MTPRGTFITFEGGEGTGKSTQIALLARRLEAVGHSVLTLREPGGSAIGEKIRAVLLDPANHEMDAVAELFLYEAARAQVVAEIIDPALEKGMVVLCDRFFDSTTAYQGYGRGIDLERIYTLNRAAVGECMPDRTIILDLDPERGLYRATRSAIDRLEAAGLEFHTRVREGFLAIAQGEPDRVKVVSGEGSRFQIADRIDGALAGLGLFSAKDAR